jgi:hypothetical protein
MKLSSVRFEIPLAALNIGPDVACTEGFKNRDQLPHRQRILPTDVNAPDEGNKCVHQYDLSSVALTPRGSIGSNQLSC